MEKFTFDIQRFACKIGDTTYSSIADAISAVPTDGTATTIELTSLCRETGISIAAGKNVTVNFAGYTYIATGDLTISTGATVNFTGGTITGTRDLTNSGTFTVTDMTMSNITLTSQSNGTTSISGDTSIKIAAGTSSYTYKLGNLSIATGGSDGSGTLTVTTASDGSATVSPAANGYFTDKTANAIYSRTNASGVTFSYNSSGTLSISNFTDTTSSSGTHTNSFSIKDNSTNSTTTYTVVGNSLLQTNDSDDTVKFWSNTSTPITQTSTLTPIDLATDSNYKFATTISNATLEFDGTLPETPLKAGEDVIVVDADDFTKTYGTLTKSGGIYHLTKNSGDIALSSITISDGSTVEFSDGYKGVEITVDTATKFKTVDSTKFTVTSSNGYASLGGTQNINLTGGSVLTSASNQTVAASSYNVYGYSGGDNGIVIATDKVGDIQVGESFVVNGTIYTRKDYGLSITVDGTEKIYVGNYDEDSYKAGIAVDLSNLNDSNFTQFSKFIQPASGVLTVGGENSLPAVVSDKQPSSSSTAVKKFGEIQIDTSTNAYTLTETDGGDISAFATTGTGTAAIATISVAGGDTTIDKTLSDGRFIATAGKAIFTVTSVSGSTFTVNGTNATPTVKDATEITLYAGSIVTDKNITQTVNLNGAQTITVTKCEMEIAFSSANTFTVTGTQGDVFTLGGKAYKIDGKSDGMTFTVDDNDVTISGLDGTGSDIFSIDGTNYSVCGAGFIKEESGAYSIWTPVKHQHTLTSGTVTYTDLTKSANWQAVATVESGSNHATLPPSTSFNSTAYLVDKAAFASIYGTFTKDGEVYKIETVDATGKLEQITFASGDLSMGTGLTDIVIAAENTTLSILDDNNNGYEVTLTSGAGGTATVSTGEHVSLIGGALQADSQVTVTVLDSVITAQGNTVVTLNAGTSDATISALATDDSFKLSDNTYTQTSVVGLINGNNQYLLGSKKDDIVISDIIDQSRWGSLVTADEFVIKDTTGNALVVDNSDNPATLYADYDANIKTISKSNGGTDWDKNIAVSIDNTTINITADFRNVTIHAAQSEADFLFGDNTTITVGDFQDGATLSANNVTLASGTVSLTSTAQVINTTGGTISGAEKITVIVSGDGKNTSIGAIDTADTFAVATANGTGTYTKNGVGLMDSDNKLLLNTASATEIPVESLTGGDWHKTDIVTKDDVLILPASTTEDDWIIVSNGKDSVYGTLTSDTAGVITVNRNNTDFAIRASVSGATFTTEETGVFTVTDGTNGATVSTNATTLNQTAGTIALVDANQSVVVTLSSSPHTIQIANNDSPVNVGVLSTGTYISALDLGVDTFVVDGTSYELLSNGRFKRGSEVWNASTISSGGSVLLSDLLDEGNWNALTKIDGEPDLIINNSTVSILADAATGAKAFVVDSKDDKTIYGTLTKTASGYTLSKDGKSHDLNSVTVTKDVPAVTFSHDFVGTTLKAGDATFIVTNSSTNFTVNYDGTTPASISDAIALTLTSGTLTLNDSTQTVTVGGQTVKFVAGTSVTVNYDGSSTVTVDDINTVGDSVTVNGNTYALTAGDFSIKVTVTDGTATTTLNGITEGDQFTIDSVTFIKTAAGFVKVVDSANAYLWTNTTDSDVNSVSVDRLIGTGTDDWTAIYATDIVDPLTINSDSKAGIFVDSITALSKIYGELTGSANNFTFKQHTASDTAPTSIKVDAVTVTVADDFNATPITAINGATVNTETDKKLTFSTESETFTVNSTAYKMTDAGLTDTTNKKIWTTGGATKYVLPADTWTSYLELDSNKKLDLTTAPNADSYIVVSKDCAARLANLTAGTNSYSFTAIDGATETIATIALGNATAAVTTDFDSTVTTGNGVYNVNGQEYTGNSLTIAATISGATKTSTLKDGTVTIAADKEVTADTTIACTSANNGITATASEGKWTSLGSLDEGDAFTVGDDKYKVLGSNVLAKLNDNGDTVATCQTSISNGKLDYSALENFDSLVYLTAEGVLDLTSNLGITSAVVVKNGDATAKVAAITYDSSTGYTLTESLANFSAMTSVLLGKTIPTFNTALETTINTADTSTTYTVNGKKFTAQDTLTIVTDAGTSDNAFLTSGTVNLAAGADSVTTRRTDSNNVPVNETIDSTNGTVTVNVANNTVTIGALANDYAFSVTTNGTTNSYIQSSIGVATSDKDKLLRGVTGTVTTEQLGGTDWLTILAAPNGEVEITSTTISATSGNVLVADLNDVTKAATYGTLTKASGTYTLTLDSDKGDVAPTSITLTGVAATLPADCKSSTIKAGGGTFTVDATGTFTVDATKTPLTFTSVTGIALSEGSLTATTSTPPITVNSKAVTVTNGTMTIGIDADTDKAYISDLDNGDTFTVQTTKYKMTEDGLFYVDDNRKVTNGYDSSTQIFTIDDEVFTPIIAVNGTTLDLTAQNETALVYNSLSNPTKNYASLEVASDGAFTLTKGDNYEDSCIKTVKLAANSVLTVKFVTQAETETSGVITVNSVNYYGGDGGITVDVAVEDGSTSTLYTGTVTLNDSYPSVKATDTKVVTFESGNGITATAKNGSFNSVGNLDTADSFTYDDTTYTQSDCGIVRGSQILEETSGNITISKLTSTDKWTNFLVPENGDLNLKTVNAKTFVYSLDSNDLPTTKLGTITISGTTYTFTSEDVSTSASNISTVNIATNSKWVFDFVTQVNVDAGIVTVNKQDYSGTTALTIDSDGTTSKLYEGTVNINSTYKSATDSASNTLKYKSGDFTATATNGAFKTIDSLNAGDSFIYNDTTYTQTDCGMIKGGQICEDLTGDSISLSDLDSANFVGFLYPVNGKLDLSSVTSGSNVYDKASPSTKLGTLTVNDKTFNFTSENSASSASNISTINIAADVNFTVDFKTQVTAAGSATVNGQSYTATDSITLDVPDETGTISTLTKGTVTLAQTEHVTITDDDNTVITATTTTDGLTVKVSGSTVTIGDITDGDVFTVADDKTDATEYKFVGSALYKTDADNKDYIYNGSNLKNNSITLANLETDWAFLLEIDGTLTVAADTLDLENNSTARLVSEDRTKIYGTLKKTGDNAYTLTAADEHLTALTVSGVSIEMDAYFKDIPTFTAGNSTLSSIALKNNNNTFTLDATGTAPKFADNVASLTLSSGNVAGVANQTVTAGTRSITPTTVKGTMVIDSEEISGLTAGDVFTVDDATTYKVLTISGTDQIFNATSPAIVTAGFTGDTLNFAAMKETQALAPTNGVTDLANMTGSNAIVLDSATTPTTQLGTVTKADNVYTVTTTDVIKVKTPATSPVTVNGVTYNGMALTLDTTADSSTLTQGTVTLANAESVTTTTGNTITDTEGDGLTVTASGSTITLGGLNTDDIFTVDGTEYRLTDAGLYKIVDKEEQIYNGTADVLGEGTITVAQLKADDVWGGVETVEDDMIVIDDKTLANGDKIKLTNEDGSKIYGELSRDADGKYTLTKTNDTTDAPTSITVDGVIAAIGSDYASVPITTENADYSTTTFTATPIKGAETFTVDATGNSPALTDVKEVELTAGALAATTNQPVTLDNGKVVTPTSGTMTINSDGVSDLAAGDKFTLTDDEASADYEVISGVGLFNATAKALVDDFTDTFNFNDTETQILAPNSSGQVDLSAMTGNDAIVFDSNTAPTKKLGTVTKSDNDYTVDFATPLKVSAGNFSVNAKDYTATSDVVIQSDGKTSTLTQGTVSLAVDDTVTTTTSGTVIKATATAESTADEESAADNVDADEDSSEVITVTVNADGTISIGALSAGDVFTVNGKQYKFAMAGLMNPDGNIWTGEDFTDSLTLTALENSDNWTAVLEVTGGNLAIDTETLAADGEVILVDNEDDPIVTYGALVKSSDGTEYTLATDDTSATLNAIAIDNTTVNIDGELASVPVTANENATFTVTPNKTKQTFTVDATTQAPKLTDNVKAVTLTAGTVTAAVKQPVTVEASTITPTTINGTMTIGMDSIGGLTAGDEFTFDNDTYKVISGVGLFNATDKTLVESYTDGTFTYTSDETQILTPNSSGQVELSKVTGTKALVFNSDTAPTTKLGEVTKADTDYTVNYSTPVKAAAGSFSVNGKDYTAATDVILQSDGTTSTLTEGTVTIAVNGSVTPTGKDTVTATSGDGLIVNVKGSTVTISGMNDGDTFTVGNAAYKVTAVGPINGDNKIWTGTKDYTDGLTTTDLATAANWSEMLSAPDGDFTVKPSTLEEGESVVVVDSTKNPTKTYGTLTKDSDRYTLTKGDDDDTLSSITDSGTIIDVDNDLAKVPVTTVVSDGSEATFTVTPAGGTDYFTVDATGTVPYINNAGSIEVIKGKITAADGIPITAADGAQDVDISAGDGTHDIGNKTVKIDGMGTDEEGNKNTVDFGTDSDGNLNSISGLKKGATVTVDGHTYTAPFDDATLKFNDNDGWYFDGYELEEYTVTVDTSGNVSVNEGVQFSKVVASGKTLDTGGTVKFAANTAKTPITVINKGTKGLNISDHTGDKLAANLGMTDGVKFSGDGTEIESLSDVAGATFTLDRDQSLTGEDATIKGGADDTEVLVASRGKFLDIDKAATVNAPSATELLLGNATYNLNGVALTTGDSTEASLTANGVTVDLAGNDPLTFKGMTVGTGGTATFDTSGNVSLTSGATADNANGNTLTINGTVGIDDKTVTVAEATKVTATANGLNVGDDTLTVTGDEDGYIINIASSAVIGLADIGSSAGVTVNGLDDATVATDKASSLTVDKTFSSPAKVTYTVADGKLVSVTNAASIGGDFANGFNVNGTNYTVKGGNATVESDGNIHTDAGTYTISGHTFTTSQPTTFTTNNASVTGAQLEGDGNFAVHQDETSFNVDGDTLTFSKNRNPVTVGTASGIVATVNGVNGLIDGLTDAVVYDVSTATINGTPISITGDVVNVPVTGGAIDTITGLDAGATVNTAPNLTLTAAENGTFTFVDDSYNVNDTVDATFDFITDSNSRVININRLSGILSGAVESVTVNGQPFASTSDDLIIETDGTDITAVIGLSSGTAIAGSLSQATMTLPEGSVTVNGAPFTLAGDSNGVELSGDGTVISGLDKDATLTVGAADTYNINGKDFAATAGQAYTVNREGVYPINASIMPITESTAAEDILALGESSIYIAPSVTGSQSIAFDSGNNVALIDSADAPTSVKTGTGTDSVVARHGAQATVDVEDGTPIIVVTNGKVTLDNYDDNADIQTFDYTDIISAVMNNDIKFGDGTMTLGDAVISFGTSAASTGATLTDIIGAAGDKQPVGFTHTNGGTLDTRSSSDNFILKGNYAQSSSDTQKGNGSSIAAGSGNDTVLVGANDTVDAGAGANQIYITDPSLKGAGATIALTSGTNTVHNFNPGFTATSDAIRISDLAALEIGFGTAGLTMASGNAQLMFDGMAAPTVTVAATSDSLNPAAPYELKLTDGTTTYNAAIAQDGKDLAVVNGTTADVFIGADNTGLSFNEYTGSVAVNLSDNEGTLDGSAAQIYGVDKVALGSGNGTLIGAENTSNTLIAGTGNGSIWSDSGNDLMRGNTSADKKGSTDFFYAGGDGKDTITNFDFMASASDTSADELVILPDARVTAVNLSGNDVVIGFNDGTDDLLTITNAKDTPFRVNGLITKVDDDIAFDGFTECYVGAGDRPTLTVGQGMGEVDIFLGDDEGTEYLGDIAVLDASAANGEMNFLAGSDTDNMIIGGSGENAIWGGDGFSNDTLVGGSGKNTFFFAAENGNDIIRNAHDGDVVDLTYLDADQFAAVEVTSDGVAIDLTDGSHLDVQSNAAVEYKLGDGNTYLVDHDAGEFNRKEN